MPLQLEGIRVVDLTSVVMGPYATQILADLGADVVVIEDRNGDTNRSMGAGSYPGLSGVSLNLMRNKRSVGLDIKSPAGSLVLQRLVAAADVFVTTLRPGSRQRAGLTYDDVRSMRSDIVYCAAAGFPADGPRADAPAYDDIVQAASGMGDVARRAGLPVSVSPTIMADKLSGMAMAQAITAALFHRLRTGEGSDLTMAMTEVVRSFVLVEHGAGSIPYPPVAPPGYSRVLDPGRRPQQTADGYISVLPYERHHYEALFRVVGREDLATDERLATRQSRLAHSPVLYQEVAAIIATRTTAAWMEVLPRVGVPCTPIATLDELVDELDIAVHPQAGAYRVVPPIVAPFVSADHVVRRPAPLPGQHGTEVLAELGYTESDIRALTAAGTLFATLPDATAGGGGTRPLADRRGAANVPAVSDESTNAFIGRPRAVVAGLPAYRPGKGIKQAESEHGITNAIKLASNENPEPTTDPIVAAVQAAAAGLNRYADHRASELRAAIAASIGVYDDQVTVGAGSSGLLQQLCMTYIEPGDEVVFPWRSFEVYPVFTALMDGVPVPVPLDADLGFDIDGLVAAITPKTKLVFLATPNNPIGNATTVTELRSLLERVPSDVVVCIDEAYREFLDPGFGDPVNELLPHFPNIVVTRTFSKAHGLAGARVGYAIGDARVIAAIDRTLLPFSVSALAQAGALAALAHPEVIAAGVDAILAERARVEVELAAAGWTFPNHQGNFVWLAVGAATDDLALGMERDGVIVRPFSGEGIRVTIGNRSENDRFLATLASVCSAAGFDPL